METVNLFHGTTPESAERLLTEGWTPGSGSVGGNCGQNRYLYLSTEREDALWFAQEKGSDIVLEVRGVPIGSLIVDPEDGVYETVEQELASLHGLPGKVALVKPLVGEHFSLSPSPGLNP